MQFTLGATLHAHPFRKRKDMRGLAIVPTRMIRLVIECGDQRAYIDLRPEDIELIVAQCARVPDAGLQEEGQIGADHLGRSLHISELS